MVSRSLFERRLSSALDAVPSRVPVVLGGCGTGRTSLLHGLRERLGRTSCQYIDIERVATTPERFLRAITASSPFAFTGSPGSSPREAFDQTAAFLSSARGPGGEPVTFLLDEVFELRTFESFPGLRQVMRDVLQAIAASSNRFVLSSRYATRALRLLRDATPRFEVVHMAPLTPDEVRDLLAGVLPLPGDEGERDYLVRAIHALAEGRPRYVAAIAGAMASMSDPRTGADPVAALASLFAPDAWLSRHCGFCYELRLHRARGYGALKAILDILAQEEPLTLTEISQRLQRTPGSTKDYLSWLEDVDLVVARQKRYSFGDPLLRLWVRVHCRPAPPTEEDIAREVQAYALARLPQPEPVAVMATAAAASSSRTAVLEEDRGKPWGIIEID